MNRKEYKLSFKNQLRAMSSLTVYRTGRQQCAPNESRGQEIRFFYLIHLVIKGKGTFILNNRQYPVETGDAFLIYPNMPINYIADGNDPWEFWWVGFNGTDAGFLLEATNFSIKNPVIHVSNPEKFRDLLSEIYAVRGNLPHQTIRMSAKLYDLLAFLIQENQDALSQKQEDGFAQFQHACDYIAKNYGNSITVDDVSKELGICRSRLYRIFMKQISVSPKKYMTEFRIRRACIMMANSDKPIKEISFRVGYKDQMHFLTVFKSIMGLTPTEFRNSALLKKDTETGSASSSSPEPYRNIWKKQD